MISHFLLLVCLFAPARAAEPPPIDVFREILKCDLVLRGKVLSVNFTLERVGDALPFLPASDPDALASVARVRVVVDEIFRGVPASSPVEFIAYVGMTHRRDNYEVGQEMVVGLMWGPNVMNGMYSMGTDARRFLRVPQGWERQDGRLFLENLDHLKAVLDKVAPDRVLADADGVIIATLVSDGVEFLKSPEGATYGLITYYLADVETLKGESVNQVTAITSGDYWPVWREDPTYPKDLAINKRYCFFLRRAGDRYVILRGKSGVYEISGDTLLLPGRRPVGLTIRKVRAQVQQP